MSSNNDNSNNDHRSLFTSLKEALVPNDQRRLTQERSHAAQDPTPRPRRESDDSFGSFSSTSPAETHHDATGSGSAFLEHLTPGSQSRRRGSILDVLRQRGSVGGAGEGELRKEKGTDKYLKYV